MTAIENKGGLFYGCFQSVYQSQNVINKKFGL